MAEIKNEMKLFSLLDKSESNFIPSTWHHNSYRKNTYIKTLWNKFEILTREHFYHVGVREKNRSPMIEALITNFKMEFKNKSHERYKKHILF